MRGVAGRDASRSASQQPERAEGQEQNHRSENDEIGKLGQHDLTKRIQQPDNDAADCGAEQAATSTNDHDRKTEYKNFGIRGGVERKERAAHQAAESGKR